MPLASFDAGWWNAPCQVELARFWHAFSWPCVSSRSDWASSCLKKQESKISARRLTAALETSRVPWAQASSLMLFCQSLSHRYWAVVTFKLMNLWFGLTSTFFIEHYPFCDLDFQTFSMFWCISLGEWPACSSQRCLTFRFWDEVFRKSFCCPSRQVNPCSTSLWCASGRDCQWLVAWSFWEPCCP